LHFLQRSDRKREKRNREQWNEMLAPLSRNERMQLAQEMNGLNQKQYRCGNVKNEVVELISENSCKCKCDERNSDKDERRARINSRRAAMKKQMNKIPDEVVPALCDAVMDTSVMLTKTGYRGFISILFIHIRGMFSSALCASCFEPHLQWRRNCTSSFERRIITASDCRSCCKCSGSS
jgi:hypothetical protein